MLRWMRPRRAEDRKAGGKSSNRDMEAVGLNINYALVYTTTRNYFGDLR